VHSPASYLDWTPLQVDTDSGVYLAFYDMEPATSFPIRPLPLFTKATGGYVNMTKGCEDR